TEFRQSLELHPTRGAVKNAALCLRKLHRFDEALDFYERLLREFPTLPERERAFAEREVNELRALVGVIQIRANENGATVVIDNRERGTTPLATPLRVSAGSRYLRVYKEGFASFEKRVEVAGGKTSTIDVRLIPPRESGRLNVTEHEGKVVSVIVDNVVVG